VSLDIRQRPMRRTRRLTLAAPPLIHLASTTPGLARTPAIAWGAVDFETDSARLLRIVRQAYARLRFSQTRCGDPASAGETSCHSGARRRRQCAIRRPVRPAAERESGRRDGVCKLRRAYSTTASALIVVARDMLRYAYHIRYDCSSCGLCPGGTVQGLCRCTQPASAIGSAGLLLMGASGRESPQWFCTPARRPRLSAEDSVLVKAARSARNGVANFVHVRRDSLRFLAAADRAL